MTSIQLSRVGHAAFDELAEVLGEPAHRTSRYDHHHGCPSCGSVDNLHLWIDARGLGAHCFGCQAGIPQIREALDLGWTPPDDLVQRQKANRRDLGQIVGRTRYTIRDAQGSARAVHVRLDTADGGKVYVWSWLPSVGKLQLAYVPLFGSEDVVGFDPSEPIIVVEGEGVRDLLATSYQVVAVAGGASSKPSREILSVLNGRELILWPDNDDAGRKLMDYVARSVRASSVVVVQPWPGVQPKDDAKDFLKNHSLEECDDLLRAATPPAPSAPQRRPTFNVRKRGWRSTQLLRGALR